MKNLSNARYLSYEEVASSFIETNNYKRLLNPCHTLIMGPRGCGKTTMLKMLNPLAASQRNLLNDLSFWGIYIPSDQQWKSQFDAIEYQFKDTNPEFAKLISKAIVNINVLIAFCDTIEALWSLADIEEGEATIYFFMELVEVWKLQKPIAPSLNAIRTRLRSYLLDIDNAVMSNDPTHELPYICKANFTNILVISTSIFENYYYSADFYCDKKKWAICLDEIEIAPKWLLDDVMKSMRSIDQRLLFKITAVPSPVTGTYNSLAATEGNDFEIISVWNYNYETVKEWNEFTRILLDKRILTPLCITYDDLSKMITSIECSRARDNYRKATNHVATELAKTDNEFYQVLLKKGADPINVDINDVKKTVMVFHYETLLQRLNYIKNIKNPNSKDLWQVYMNPRLLTDFCDGNPRALINFYTVLFDLVNDAIKKGNSTMVNVQSFSQKLKDFTHSKVYNKLAFQSMSPICIENREFTYKQLLDIIGSTFCSRLNGKEFISEPENFFTYESDEFEPFIQKALETGSVILIEDSSEYKGVRGGVPVYRLNYGLFPYYHFLRTGSRKVLYLDDMVDAYINESHEN